MGVKSIFNPTANSLNQITDSLYVSTYEQIAKIKVNEKGTEAAAVTTIGWIVSGLCHSRRKDRSHPFCRQSGESINLPSTIHYQLSIVRRRSASKPFEKVGKMSLRRKLQLISDLLNCLVRFKKFLNLA